MNLNFPDAIIYYSQKTDFENHEIRSSFIGMNFEDVKNLNVDDLYFKDRDFQPKVYGYRTMLVKHIEKNNLSVVITNQFDEKETFTENTCDIYKIKDIDAFKELINTFPKATRISGFRSSFRFANI